MTRRALVTGGAGFIGSHLVEQLLAAGHAVTVLDHFAGERPENLDHIMGRSGLSVVRGNILDRDLVRGLVGEAEVVFHLAAVKGVRRIVEDPLGAMRINVHGTENVLEAALAQRTRVLLASTSEIYGQSPHVPFREDGPRVLGPTSVHRWSYSTAKALDEHLAYACADQGLPISIVRFFNVYGPRLHPSGDASVIARFAAQAITGEPLTIHGDGEQTRCFTYIADAVRATMLAASLDSAVGSVFNVGTSEEISIAKLAALIVRLAGSSSEIRLVPSSMHYRSGFEDTRRRVPDVRRAAEVLGFTAEVKLERGLEETLRWCERNYPH